MVAEIRQRRKEIFIIDPLAMDMARKSLKTFGKEEPAGYNPSGEDFASSKGIVSYGMIYPTRIVTHAAIARKLQPAVRSYRFYLKFSPVSGKFVAEFRKPERILVLGRTGANPINLTSYPISIIEYQ